jgi:septum site-determining protein MinC
MTSASQAVLEKPSDAPAIQIRGASYTLLVLSLPDPKDQSFYSRLADKIGQAPNFFRLAPVVVDLKDLADAPPFNMAEMGRRLRQHSLIPIGVQNGTAEQNKVAVDAGWTVFREGRPALVEVGTDGENRAADPVEAQPQAVAAPDDAPGSSALVITQPVRSGRQVYAHQGDLVVLATASPGAELLADGHIHVYGPLRGRALAGVSGDTRARIFCRSLEAELVSVAGYWRVRDDIPEDLIGKPVQIFLEDERVMIEPLS